jgi:catechol 2,3-dioxygenase
MSEADGPVIGAVRLTVADLERAVEYYERAIGLRVLARDGDLVRLGVDAPLVELAGDPDAPPAPPGSTGLFHLAILVPSRPELARAVRRVVDAGERFTGASDHLVSEAVYLRDPEGNGIEIYYDRPRAEWTWKGDEVEMATLALDLRGVLTELPAGADGGMPAGTIVGHVHLQVSDLGPTEAFYAGELGFDVTTRSYPGALFLSRGGYHHHIGANTWVSRGGAAPPSGSRGLAWFEVDLPGEGLVADASGNRLRLTRASDAPTRPRDAPG